jgi:hypothetical protein
LPVRVAGLRTLTIKIRQISDIAKTLAGIEFHLTYQYIH